MNLVREIEAGVSIGRNPRAGRHRNPVQDSTVFRCHRRHRACLEQAPARAPQGEIEKRSNQAPRPPSDHLCQARMAAPALPIISLRQLGVASTHTAHGISAEAGDFCAAGGGTARRAPCGGGAPGKLSVPISAANALDPEVSLALLHRLSRDQRCVRVASAPQRYSGPVLQDSHGSTGRRGLRPARAQVVQNGIGAVCRRLALASWGGVALVGACMGIQKQTVRHWSRRGIEPSALCVPFARCVESIEERFCARECKEEEIQDEA